MNFLLIFLGDVPLDLRIRETSDAGLPIVLAEPKSQQVYKNFTPSASSRFILELETMLAT